MASYLILGAGKFGASGPAAAGPARCRGFIFGGGPRSGGPGRGPGPEIPGVVGVESEAVAFLAARLEEPAPWDWLIPMVPVHLAWAWLLAGPLRGWEPVAVPGILEAVAPVAFRGPEGQVYLSRAAHLCPDDCSEPDSVCPVNGESREVPLFAALAALELPGWTLRVMASRQLAPGVGGYPPGELLALARELQGLGGQVLIATACRCHGVVHGLEKDKFKVQGCANSNG